MRNLERERKAFEDITRSDLCQRLREIRANLGTQEVVAALLNHDQSLISRYEQGKRIPSLNYIRQLARHVKLSYIEEQYLLGLAGVLVSTRMPSPEQIQNGMIAYCRDMQHDWYPSAIVDHNFGIWVMNEAAYEVLGEAFSKSLIAQYITILEMLFSADLHYNPEKLVHEAVSRTANQSRRKQIALFKLFNIQRRHEAFYRNYPQHLGYFGQDKPRIHAKSFLPIWHDVDILSAKGELQLKEGSIEISGILPAREKIDVRYRQRLEQIPHLPMFCIIRFEPLPKYEYLFARHKWVSDKIIKIWEITDIEPIIEGIDSLNLLAPVRA